jgi:hypothetical protein
LLGLFDEHNFSAQLFKPFAMRVKIALQCKDTDLHESRRAFVVVVLGLILLDARAGVPRATKRQKDK